ncbi:glutathione S-transferase U17-like [Carex rostrata]
MAVVVEEVKLIGSPSSLFTCRPRVALNLKGVEYDFLQEKWWKKSDQLLESNPVYKKIPVLIHNNKPICESMIIVEYIDETWTSIGPSILPSDSYDRAMAKFWTAYSDDKFPALLRNLTGPVPGDIPEATEQFIASLQLLEAAFEKCSKGKRFFGGDEIGYLDIALGSHFGWIGATEKLADVRLLEKEKVPHLVEWYERYFAHPAVKDVMPTTDELLAFVTEVKSNFTAPAN